MKVRSLLRVVEVGTVALAFGSAYLAIYPFVTKPVSIHGVVECSASDPGRWTVDGWKIKMERRGMSLNVACGSDLWVSGEVEPFKEGVLRARSVRLGDRVILSAVDGKRAAVGDAVIFCLMSLLLGIGAVLALRNPEPALLVTNRLLKKR